jgi:D-glycero-D-manno-heptose 1,7-bisphosphate phosphatase
LNLKSPLRRAVFVDRDGVINRTFERDGKQRAPDRLEDFEFLEGVEEAVVALRAAGFLVVVVTNQPDVARGWQSLDRVEAMNALVQERLRVDDIRVCFHIDQDGCLCRKPLPGMLLAAAEDASIDLRRSFMVGDRFGDIEAGQAAGCKTILVGDGYGETSRVLPDKRVLSLLEASRVILGLDGEH